MRVALIPTGEERRPLICHVVAIGVFQIQSSRSILHDHTTAVKNHRRGNAQLIGEHRELIGPPVAIRVGADADAIAAGTGRLQFVGVVERFGHPQTAPFVPRHGQWLAA